MKTVIVVSALLAMLTAACESTREHGSSKEPAPLQVSVDRVVTADLPSRIEAGGIVQAAQTAHVASRVVAPIQEVHVQAGDRVKRGQTLVTLDARELTANAARASAGLVGAIETLHAAESRSAAAEADLRLASATYERIHALHEKKSATPQELDQAVAAFRAAEARLSTARAESAAAMASHDAARAAAEAARVALSYATLAAPFDGVIAERIVDPGSLAAPGVPILIVEASGAPRLEVRLDESRADLIAQGQPAEVRFGDNTKWIPAEVVEVGRADPASHSFVVKLEVSSATDVRSGSFGRARFAGDPRRTLVVASSSLIRRGGLTFAFTVGTDNRARLQPVVMGRRDGDQTEVLAGLAEGDRVIVDPPLSLSDGSRLDLHRTPENGGSGGDGQS